MHPQDKVPPTPLAALLTSSGLALILCEDIFYVVGPQELASFVGKTITIVIADIQTNRLGLTELVSSVYNQGFRNGKTPEVKDK